MSYICIHIEVDCDNAPSLYEYIIITEEEAINLIKCIDEKRKRHEYFQLKYNSNLITFYYGKITYTIYREKEMINAINLLNNEEHGINPFDYSRIGNECIYEILIK